MILHPIRTAKSFSLTSLFIGLIWFAYPYSYEAHAITPATNTQKSPTKSVTDVMKEAIAVSAQKLQLSPSENKILELEVFNDPQTFVKNLSSEAGNPTAEVDESRLADYLKFNATQASSGISDGAKFCVRGRGLSGPSTAGDTGCAACDVLALSMDQSSVVRFSRRGFATRLGVEATELGGSRGDLAFNEFAEKSKSVACEHFYYLEIERVVTPDDDHDSLTIPVRVNAYFQLSNRQGMKVRQSVSQSTQIPVNLDPDLAFKQYAGTLNTKILSQLFSLILNESSKQQARVVNTEAEQILRFEGFASFHEYVSFKQGLINKYPDMKIEERFMSPGKITFALQGAPSMGELSSFTKTMLVQNQEHQNRKVYSDFISEREVLATVR